MGSSRAQLGARTRPLNPKPIQLTGLQVPPAPEPARSAPRLRPERLAAGALLLAAPASAALAASPAAADAPSAAQAQPVAFSRVLSADGTAAQPGGKQTPLTARQRSMTSKLTVHTQQVASLGGQAVTVRGQLRPKQAGHRLVLQGHEGHWWTTLDVTRTQGSGHFRFHFTPKVATHESLRVRFAGNRSGKPTTRRAGSLTVFGESLVSWYYDGGNTACGFHAYYGVANTSLPCGTKVAFRSGSRTVVATVDDRGPYVGGREYDLNQNLAQALGFGGVGDVWTSVQ